MSVLGGKGLVDFVFVEKTTINYPIQLHDVDPFSKLWTESDLNLFVFIRKTKIKPLNRDLTEKWTYGFKHNSKGVRANNYG